MTSSILRANRAGSTAGNRKRPACIAAKPSWSSRASTRPRSSIIWTSATSRVQAAFELGKGLHAEVEVANLKRSPGSHVRAVSGRTVLGGVHEGHEAFRERVVGGVRSGSFARREQVVELTVGVGKRPADGHPAGSEPAVARETSSASRLRRPAARSLTPRSTRSAPGRPANGPSMEASISAPGVVDLAVRLDRRVGQRAHDRPGRRHHGPHERGTDERDERRQDVQAASVGRA
jgi:hypothetical protein